MTIEDGEKINKSFEEKQRTIDSLLKNANLTKAQADSLKEEYRKIYVIQGMRLQRMYESYMQEKNDNDSLRAQRDSAVIKYMANKKIYEKQERKFLTEVRHSIALNFVLAVFIAFLSAR